MTSKHNLSKDEKTLQSLEEICENTRAIRRVVNRIFDHLHETQESDNDFDPDTMSWKDLYENDDMYYWSRNIYKYVRFHYLMIELSLPSALRRLRESLQQIKTLLAWEQLKQSEARPDQPPSFQMDDPTESDLKDEYSFFLYVSMQIRTILNDSSIIMTQAERQTIGRQLTEVEQQLYGLNLHQRFCEYKTV